MTQVGEEAARLPAETATGVEAPATATVEAQHSDASIVPPSGLRESADVLTGPEVKTPAEAPELEAEAEAEVDAFAEVDFARESSPEGESSDSSGGPPLDAYWSSMLNVTKTAAPLKPPKMLSEGERPRDRGRGGRGGSRGGRPSGKGDGKGKGLTGGKAGMFYMAPMHPLTPMAPMAFFAAGGKGFGCVDANPPVDANTEQGSRQRSRSPHGHANSDDLRNFLSASRDESAANEESLEGRKAQDDKINESIKGFLA